MKRLLVLVVLISSLVYACKNYDNNDIVPGSKVNIDIQSTGFESLDMNGNVRQAFLDFDSIYVNIQSFKLVLGKDTLEYLLSEEDGRIDLLSFISKDTILWNNVNIATGDLGKDGFITLSNENTYLICSTGDKYPLKIKDQILGFKLISSNEIEYGKSYGIKLDLMNSLQIIEGYEDEYTLVQGDENNRNYGMMFLYKVDENK